MLCEILHKLCKFTLFVANLPLFRITHFFAKFWPWKLRLGKSFDKYHVCDDDDDDDYHDHDDDDY